MKAIINTSLVTSSWMTAGISPWRSNFNIAHRDSFRSEIAFGVVDTKLPEVEYGGRQSRVRFAEREALVEMLERANPAGRDNRHRHGLRNERGQGQVVALPRPIAIHAG